MADLSPLSSLVRRSGQTGARESRSRGQEAAGAGLPLRWSGAAGRGRRPATGKRTCRLWFVMENTTACLPLSLLLWTMDLLWVLHWWCWGLQGLFHLVLAVCAVPIIFSQVVSLLLVAILVHSFVHTRDFEIWFSAPNRLSHWS